MGGIARVWLRPRKCSEMTGRGGDNKERIYEKNTTSTEQVTTGRYKVRGKWGGGGGGGKMIFIHHIHIC